MGLTSALAYLQLYKTQTKNPSNGMTHVFESESRAILHDINHPAFNATRFCVSVSVIFPEEILKKDLL